MTARASGSGQGLPSNVVTKTTTYSASSGDYIKADATSAGFTITLPSNPTTGALVAVKKTDPSTNVVTIVPQSGNIDGDPNATIVSQYAGGVLEHVGSNVWHVTSIMSAVGPTGDTGPQGSTGGFGTQPALAAGVLNRWYPGDGMSAFTLTNSNEGNSVGTMILGTPVIAQRDMTIDALGAYVQTADASGNLRIGLYEPIDQANPYDMTISSNYATRIVDGGTVSAATTGAKTVSISQVITAGTAFCVGVAIQGASLGLYFPVTGNNQSVWGSATILGVPNAAVTMSGVTGALPATFTPAAYYTLARGGPGWYRRSA